MKKLMCLLLFGCVLNQIVSAREGAYSAVDQYVGISGSTEYFEEFDYKFGINYVRLPEECYSSSNDYKKKETIQKLEAAFERENTGRMILDYLMCNRYSEALKNSVDSRHKRYSYKSSSVDSIDSIITQIQFNSFKNNDWSEDLLKKRAIKIIHKSKMEQAYGVIDAETILREDIRPILKNNYIVLVNDETWIVFKVDITDDIIDYIYANPDWVVSPNIKVNVKCVDKGKTKSNFEKFANNFSGGDYGYALVDAIGNKVPAFGIPNQITGVLPITMDYNKRQNLKNGDRLNIFRNIEKDGKVKSTRIGRARFINANSDSTSATLTMIAGRSPSYKRGDVAVLNRDYKGSGAITVGYKNGGGFALNYMGDYLTNVWSGGFTGNFLYEASLGAYVLDVDEVENLLGEKTGALAASIRLGYGVGKRFLNNIELLPYIAVENEIATLSLSVTQEEKEMLIEEYDMNINSYSMKLPIGLKVNVNIYYPVQLTLGAEYSLPLFSAPFNMSTEEDLIAQGMTPEQAKTLSGIMPKAATEFWNTKKFGFNIYGGIKIAF